MINIRLKYFPSSLHERIKDRFDLATHVFELSKLLVVHNFEIADQSKCQKIEEETIIIRFVDDTDEINYNRVFVFKKNSCIATFIFPFFLVKNLQAYDDCAYELRLSFGDGRFLDYDIIANLQKILINIKEQQKRQNNLYSLFQTFDMNRIVSEDCDKDKNDEEIRFYEEILSVVLFYHDGYARRDIIALETKSKTPHPLDHMDLSYVYKNYDLKIELKNFQEKDIFNLFSHTSECFCLIKPEKTP